MRLRIYGDDLSFPLSVFDDPAGVERADTPLGAGLRLAVGNAADLLPFPVPSAEWRLLAVSDAQALFGHGEPPEVATMLLRLQDDEWVFEGLARAATVEVARTGLERATWVVAGPVTADATDLPIDVSTNGRAVAPEVVEDETSVTISCFAGPPFAQMKGWPPKVRVVVPLDRPFGGRRLLDGAVYPARAV